MGVMKPIPVAAGGTGSTTSAGATSNILGAAVSSSSSANVVPQANSGGQLASGFLARGTPSAGQVAVMQDDGKATWATLSGFATGAQTGGIVSGALSFANGQTRTLDMGVCSTIYAMGVHVQTAGATNQTDTSITFDSSTGYTQEDNTKTEFRGGLVALKCTTPSRTILLHFNGSDASTTIDDDGSNGGQHTWTCVGNAQLDTSQFKFGTASLLLDGTGDRVQLTATSDMLFTGDFTVSMWVRPASLPAISVLLAPTDTANNFQLAFYSTGRIDFYQGSTQVCTSATGIITSGSWQHVALTRTGSTCKIWVGGVEVASGTRSGSVGRSDTNFNIGMYADGSYPVNGWIDEFAVDSSTCLYTGTFTPPSAAWDSADYSTSQAYYVLTPYQVNLAAVSNIDSVTFDVSVPTGATLTVVYSVDNGATWKNHSGTTVAAADIDTQGSTYTQIQTALANYAPSGSDGKLCWGFALGTSDATVTPVVRGVSVQYDAQSSWRLPTALSEWTFDIYESAGAAFVNVTRVSGGTVTARMWAIGSE